jgi:hypothetical protein
MDLITESNADIDWMVSKLDFKVREFRIKYPKSRIKPEIDAIYSDKIIKWMESYVFNDLDISGEEDEILKNSILDMANRINYLMEDGINLNQI